MTSNAVQRPQTTGALRVAAAWTRLRRSASSTMTRHRLDRRAWHPGPRRSQRDPRDFYHGLLANAVTLNPICQEELYDPGRDVSINPNENSILTP